MRFPGPHQLQDVVLDVPATLLRQEPVALAMPSSELSRHYRRLSLRDVFLGFAGYRRP